MPARPKKINYVFSVTCRVLFFLQINEKYIIMWKTYDTAWLPRTDRYHYLWVKRRKKCLKTRVSIFTGICAIFHNSFLKIALRMHWNAKKKCFNVLKMLGSAPKVRVGRVTENSYLLMIFFKSLKNVRLGVKI